MKITLIRNATLLLEYGGHRFLIDPDFSPKHTRRSFTGKSMNPMVDLPMSTDAILDGVEVVIVSHLHADHFDTVAKEVVPKSLPLFCQPGNDASIKEAGFEDVSVIETTIKWEGIKITRTGGHHGTGDVEAKMGTVSGFVFQAPGEPTLYWEGDTVLCDEVKEAVKTYTPDIIVTHSCGATWEDDHGQRQLIVMDDEQTIKVCQMMNGATIVATHMEALDHSTISRDALRTAALQAGISQQQLLIPAEGETIEFE